MKLTHNNMLQLSGLNFCLPSVNPVKTNYNFFSYTDKLKLHRIRTQHPGMEKTIILLATMAAKNKLRIILADDDEDDRELFAEAIGDSRVHLETAKDGIALMKLLNSMEVNPDIIFLDLNMPGKGGKKCLEEIRNNKKFALIPIVIYSTSSSAKDIDDTYQMGANLYIRKPNSFIELTEVIKKVFSLDWDEYKPNTHKTKFVFNITSN